MKIENNYSARMLLLFSLLWSVTALAGDGQLEINQACAVQTGCFSGDAAGFPVTIVVPGSYRFTGSLDLAKAPAVDAVFVSAPAVTLDMGGFQIIGPGGCSGAGANISCIAGAGSGVIADTSASGFTARNGVIRNMGTFGLTSSGPGSRVENVTAFHNANDGIGLDAEGLVINCNSFENGEEGIDVPAGSVVDGSTASRNKRHGIELEAPYAVVTRSTALGNGGRGFNLVALAKFGKDNVSGNNGETDSCGGRFCSENKRFYLEGSFSSREPVPSSFCDPGFRPISGAALVAGHLTYYEGTLRLDKVQLRSTRYVASVGGGFGSAGTFDCFDSASGFTCSNFETIGLTSGWHALTQPQSRVFSPTICIEE